MGLNNIKKKGEQLGKKPASSYLKINMYENPQMALDLIAHICTASKDIDVSDCFSPYQDLVLEMKDKLEGQTFQNSDFISDCVGLGKNLQDKLLDDVSANLKIAVAGGYSAGKSSLLNALTGVENMLPTGIDPVSMVNTYLNCSSKNQRLVVKGENIRNDIVLLNKDVLACVQHASKSKVYVASVLNKILLDIPSPKELDGITFIDTPGYNNSNDITKGSFQTDSDKAINAIKQADAVFWCIDSEAGTIPSTDLDMLKRIEATIEDAPLVIFFTKMDKKRPEMDKILKLAQKTCENELSKKPLDIFGVSCVDGKPDVISLSKSTDWGNLIERIRKNVGPTDYYKLKEFDLRALINNEINVSKDCLRTYKKNILKSIEDKGDLQKWYHDTKNDIEQTKTFIRKIIIDGYNEIMEAADTRLDAYESAMNGWSEALDREAEWNAKSGIFSDTSSLNNQHNNAINSYNRLVERDLRYTYFQEEDRQEICEDIDNVFDKQLSDISSLRESEEDNYRNQVQSKKTEETLISVLKEYKPLLLQKLKECYENCRKRIQDHNTKLQGIISDDDVEVFSSIYGDNWKRFLVCFSNGVQLDKTNAEGYTPLTLACKMGNNEMVKFFIDHGADLSQRDAKGYNALETAVINHYKDICELLLKADDSLVAVSKSLTELAQQNTFVDWVSNI